MSKQSTSFFSLAMVIAALFLVSSAVSAFGPETISFSQSELNDAQASSNLVFVSENKVENMGKFLYWRTMAERGKEVPTDVQWTFNNLTPVASSTWSLSTIQAHRIKGDRYYYLVDDLMVPGRRVQMISFDEKTGDLVVLFGYPNDSPNPIT